MRRNIYRILLISSLAVTYAIMWACTKLFGRWFPNTHPYKHSIPTFENWQRYSTDINVGLGIVLVITLITNVVLLIIIMLTNQPRY